MKKTVMIAALAMVLVIVFGGCRKFFDWKHGGHHDHDPGCRIKKMTMYEGADTMYANFNYNHKGDPVSVITSAPSTGRPHFTFRYDHKGRLKEFLAPYSLEPNTNYEQWFTYQYDWKGRIIGDTAYNFGYVENGVPQPINDFKSYATYYYDAWDRVVKVVRTYLVPGLPQNPVTTEEYVYDDDGNLEWWLRSSNTSPTVIENQMGPYGNKRNVRHTNKIWMFIDRNYSVNDEAGAVAHNAAGLPLRYEPPIAGYYRSLLYSIDLTNAELEYTCHGKK